MEAAGQRRVLWTGADEEWVGALGEGMGEALDPEAEVTVVSAPALSVARQFGGQVVTGPIVSVWTADRLTAVLAAFAYGWRGAFEDVLCLHAVMTRQPGPLAALREAVEGYSQILVEALESLLVRRAGVEATADLLTVRAGAREA